MDSAELADPVVIADFQSRGLAMILQILRRCADRGELEDVIAGTDRGEAFDNRIGADHGAGADFDLLADDRSRPDLDRGVEVGARIDDSAGMDAAAYGCSPTDIAEISASAASSPPTCASPRIFHSGG